MGMESVSLEMVELELVGLLYIANIGQTRENTMRIMSARISFAGSTLAVGAGNRLNRETEREVL
jgi:hypothetical protein